MFHGLRHKDAPGSVLAAAWHHTADGPIESACADPVPTEHKPGPANWGPHVPAAVPPANRSSMPNPSLLCNSAGSEPTSILSRRAAFRRAVTAHCTTLGNGMVV